MKYGLFYLFKKLEYLVELIEKGKASSPTEIAKKFECSPRTIKRMVDVLRLNGYDICYCRKNMKYIKKYTSVRLK